jgi:hypothetical protein
MLCHGRIPKIVDAAIDIASSGRIIGVACGFASCWREEDLVNQPDVLPMRAQKAAA